MVFGAFPVIKFGGLLLKHLTSPITRYLKVTARRNLVIRKCCVKPAQFYNWCEVQMKMWVLNMGKPVEVPKLNEAMAIELGANLLGETIIFCIAAALLSFEFARQGRKEAKKEEIRKDEMESITGAIHDLYCEAQKHQVELVELRRKYYDLESLVQRINPRPYGPGGSRRSPPSEQTIIQNISFPADEPYYKGTILQALDYFTYQMPNGQFR